MQPHLADGLFVRDTRVLSRWQLRIDGDEIESLGVQPSEPYECRFVGRVPARPGQVEATLVVERHRMVGHGMREDVTVTNYGMEPAGVDVSLHIDVDFADLFEVKERRPVRPLAVTTAATLDALTFSLDDGGADARGVRITASGARAVPGALLFQTVIPAKGAWQVSVEVTSTSGVLGEGASFPLDQPLDGARPAQRMRRWRHATAKVSVDNAVLAAALRTSQRDLGALRIIDPDNPEDDVVAAGAPWFMALFGRDSLLTGHMMMPFAPDLALGTLRTLARRQGASAHPMTEEQPGRILHEVRLGADASLALGSSRVYYGSVDSTPLFVMLAGEALRWDVDRAALLELMPAVEAAVGWILHHGDLDSDGFVEYRRTSDRGLWNQGWKDSSDSMNHRSGAEACPPMALAEVQGYCYAALLAAADLDDALAGGAKAAGLRRRAADLKQRFHQAFWCPEIGFYAMALDRDKLPLEVVSSNIGHCLWTGIIDDDHADRVVARLLADDMFTGFGLRTLSSEEARYNPISYHNGSVWPHDTVLAAAGMQRYGRRDEALRLLRGLLDAAEAFDGRLPELLGGFSRAEHAVPVPYPTSCSPQAWAAATPFEMLRILLALHADGGDGGVAAGPVPAFVGAAAVTGIRVGRRSFDVVADCDEVRITPAAAQDGVGIPGRPGDIPAAGTSGPGAR
ncbi:amylo-alpha-1,6-glucosidase [Tessaracoccus sp. Z1128]